MLKTENSPSGCDIPRLINLLEISAIISGLFLPLVPTAINFLSPLSLWSVLGQDLKKRDFSSVMSRVLLLENKEVVAL